MCTKCVLVVNDCCFAQVIHLQVGAGTKAIIVFYDVFGFTISNTRQFCDLLAGKGYLVLMADHFRGQPWPLDRSIPDHLDEFTSWRQSVGANSKVIEDVNTLLPWIREQGVNNIACLGFCWGGKQVMNCCARGAQHFCCGASLHPAFLSEEDAVAVQAPLALMPAGDDPDIAPIQAVLSTKSFGAKCCYRRFSEEKHGFASARGDWSVEHTRAAVEEALSLLGDFYGHNLV